VTSRCVAVRAVEKLFLPEIELRFLDRPACCLVDCFWNVMAHAQKPGFVFRRNGRVHLNRRGRQFSRLLAGEVCASAVVMLDTPCSEVVWRVLATHCIRQFPIHLPYRASPCAITFQLEPTTGTRDQLKCDDTRAETRFRLSAKLTSPFILATGLQFSRLLAAEACPSAVVMLNTPCSEVVWRVLATHCIRQFPIHLPSRASPCAITFQPDSSCLLRWARHIKLVIAVHKEFGTRTEQ